MTFGCLGSFWLVLIGLACLSAVVVESKIKVTNGRSVYLQNLCENEESNPICLCLKACPRRSSPYCALSTTWINKCHFDQFKCRIQVDAEIEGHRGPCKKCSKCSRILGGKIAKANQFPYMVGLKQNSVGRVICGGVLISDQYVLTATHCIINQDPKDHVALVGFDNQFKKTGDAKEIGIASWETHENFKVDDGVFARNDIGIIKLSEKVQFSHAIKAIKLPPKDKDYKENDTMIVIGWGSTTLAPNNTYPAELQYADVRVHSYKKCQDRWRDVMKEYNKDVTPVFDTKTEICGFKENVSSYAGDSGGPLVIEAGDQSELVGLVSYGDVEEPTKTPVNYVKVSGLIDWINGKMK